MNHSETAILNEQQHHLISHLTHEVRNPLTLVSCSLQLLEKDCPSVKNSPLWLQIREDIQSTISLLQEISVWNNTSICKREEINIKEFLSGLAVSFSSYMAERGITFSVHISDSLIGQILSADKSKLQEALTNLLINAADAADPSQPSESQISLTAELFDKNLHIHVKDNGSGIPESYLPTLFEPFITHKTTGTGLGLSIVRNVARLHGGSISVNTSCTSGSSYTDFCLILPLV